MNPDPPRLPLVLLHGLLSTPQEFGLIALSMRHRGLDLVTPRIAGYSGGNRLEPTSWRRWAAAASAAIAQAIPVGQPFVLGGMCAGGLMAAAIAIEGGHRVEGLVLMSPTFDYDGWGQNRWRHLRKLGYALGLDRWITVAERDPYGIKNEKIRAWVAREMKQRSDSAAGPSTLPLWAIHEVDRLADRVRADLPRLEIRTLILHARDDEICTLASAQRALQRIKAHDKKLVILENSYHMITIDNDRHRVADELLAFSIPVAAATPTGRLADRSAPHTLESPAPDLQTA